MLKKGYILNYLKTCCKVWYLVVQIYIIDVMHNYCILKVWWTNYKHISNKKKSIQLYNFYAFYMYIIEIICFNLLENLSINNIDYYIFWWLGRRRRLFCRISADLTPQCTPGSRHTWWAVSSARWRSRQRVDRYSWWQL